eukprot:CAMPEP_0201492246 /NCGR_PEP_ID=MMETSP0151_2-20130828/32376_1 /ASSEMBLY_ACC=CAM_ASM_000257 /TAXON_ID=200890 /ORGANISM="Paramoeba atlantica, Strain 621/1 / CCAP 1560/9" /LENGTH=526 /DNA_ID=CAMNT_0047878961 /DNA_START=59 /DNA_END=1639 /DNA_ORIENTATION=+
MDKIKRHLDEMDAHLGKIESMNRVEGFLLQQHPMLKKSYLVLGFILLFFFLIFFDLGASLLTNFVAFVFPAYQSIRALQTKETSDDTQWLTYWTVFSLTVVTENFLYTLFEDLSLYFTIKYVVCIWLMYPGTRGAQFVFEHIILAIPALRIKEHHSSSLREHAMSSFNVFLDTVSGKGIASKEDRDSYSEQVESAVPSIVRMFSGCMDEQTSADVHDTGSFGISPALGPSGAGGACTNSFLLTMESHHSLTWGQLLAHMRDVLGDKKYTQVPQLSASRDFELSEEFSLINPVEKVHNGKRRALLIGINYVGTKAELKGCINDIKKIRKYLEGHGFSEFKELSDEGTKPTVKNIVEGIMWLVNDAQPGDSLFMHYSGHGGRIPDDSNDEHDGYDETMVPLDYQSKGQIRDDDLFKILIAPLPKECYMTVIMDCCHSGSILDLPYTIKVDGSMGELGPDEPAHHLGYNPRFSLTRVYQVLKSLFDRFKKSSSSDQPDSRAADIEAIKSAMLGSVLISESGEKQSFRVD